MRGQSKNKQGRRRSRAMSYCAVLLVALGCASPTDPDSDLDFFITGTRPGVESTATAEGAGSSIRVIGTITVSESCRRFQPTLTRDGSNLELIVVASRPSSANCQSAVTSFDYEARIKELNPGVYALTIRHNDMGVEEIRLIQSISVT